MTVQTGGPPALLAFREADDRAWRAIDPADKGTFELEVAGPYRVAVACPSSDDFVVVSELAATLDDDRLLEYPCARADDRPYAVSGRMLQPGSVSFARAREDVDASGWRFELSTAAGTFDLVAQFGSSTDGYEAVAIRRDIAVSSDLAIGAIDAAEAGTVAMVPTRLVATNAEPGEVLSSITRLYSGG